MVSVAEEYTFDGFRLEGTFRSYKQTVAWHEVNERNLTGQPISQSELSELGRLLGSGQPVELHHRLLLDAKEQAFVHHQPDLAVVLIGTAFDVFLQHKIVEAADALGYTDLPLDPKKAKKSQPVQRAPVTEAVARGGVQERLLRYVEMLTKKTLLGTRIHNDWFDRAFNVRNRVIHKGFRALQQADAQQAFEATNAYMRFIETSLSEARAAHVNSPASFL